MARALPPYLASAVLLAVAGVAFTLGMGPAICARMLFGPTCSGHGSAFALHCPACYLAAALVVGALIVPLGRTYMTRARGSATLP